MPLNTYWWMGVWIDVDGWTDSQTYRQMERCKQMESPEGWPNRQTIRQWTLIKHATIHLTSEISCHSEIHSHQNLYLHYKQILIIAKCTQIAPMTWWWWQWYHVLFFIYYNYSIIIFDLLFQDFFLECYVDNGGVDGWYLQAHWFSV